MNAKLGYWTP